MLEGEIQSVMPLGCIALPAAMCGHSVLSGIVAVCVRACVCVHVCVCVQGKCVLVVTQFPRPHPRSFPTACRTEKLVSSSDARRI